MRKTFSVLVLLAVALMVVGCKSKEEREREEKAANEDKAKLQGNWTAKIEGATENDDEEALKSGVVYNIDEDVMRVKLGNQVLTQEKFTLNAVKEPKEIDLKRINDDGSEYTIKGAKTKTKKGKTKQATIRFRKKGIYKIDKDGLTMALVDDDQSRPKDFTAAPGKQVVTLSKVKGKDDKKEEKEGKEDKEDKENKKENKKEKKENKTED
jgi:uncharacterized protein (TIGR03067 family)